MDRIYKYNLKVIKIILCSLLFIMGHFLILSQLNAYESIFKDLALKKDFYVIRVRPNQIYTDIGRDQGAFKGLKINIYRQMEEIKHPITGELLGITKDKICTGRITEVFQRYSVAETNCKNAKVKDIANVDLDISVYVLYKNEVEEYFKRLVENDVASQNFSLANSLQDADLILEVAKVYRGEYSTNLKTKNDIVIATNIIKEEEKLTSEGQFKDRKKYDVDEFLRSISVADVDKDNIEEIVGSSKTSIYIYTIDNETIKKKTHFGKFDNIVNIEVADLNDDGYYEIFVVDYPYAGKLTTYVYEYDGQAFVKKATLSYFVRSFIVEGEPYIIGQRQHFEYLARGNIFTVVFEDGDYKEGITFDAPEGYKLYGFYTEGADAIYIDDDGKILKAEGRKVVDQTPASIGKYINTFQTQLGTLEGSKRKDLFNERADDAFRFREDTKKLVFEFSPKSRLFKYNNFLYAFINIPITSFIESKLVVTASKILQIGLDSMIVNYVGGNISKNTYDMYMKVNDFGEYYFYVLESNSTLVDIGFLGSGKSSIVVLKF